MKLIKHPKIQDVMTTHDRLTVGYEDGRIISLPLKWYPRLNKASPSQRRNWVIIGRGYGVHWPEVDEDLSAEGLLEGRPAREYSSLPKHSSKRARQAIAS